MPLSNAWIIHRIRFNRNCLTWLNFQVTCNAYASIGCDLKSTKPRSFIMSKQVLYTGKTHTTGGREGAARSSDGHLDVKLSSPGSNGQGTNPEQLFAAGWSACFIGAMGLTAGKLG